MAENTIEEKNEQVQRYLSKVIAQLNKSGLYPTKEQLDYVYGLFIDSDKTIDEIMGEIDLLVDEYIENMALLKEMDKMQKPIDAELENTGITLNEQDIDLMKIANASSLDELRGALDTITNIDYPLPDSISDEEFDTLREEVFNKYIESLISKIDYLKDNSILQSEKIRRVQESGFFNKDELVIFNNVIKSGNYNEIISNLNSIFSEERVQDLLVKINGYKPIEKTGIKDTTITTYQAMYKELLNNFDSVTLDEVSKYGYVALGNGTFNFNALGKNLEFCKSINKQVRLNTLLFYKDCPDDLYNLEVTPENKEKVKTALSNYVDSITSFIKVNGYEDTIRSIDVFNELLNRFPLDGDIPYQLRGDIPQGGNADDNIKSGWFKHLSIEDVCDVISIARRNLPNTDFMFNDDNLIDPNKIDANAKILERINNYEKSRNIKLIDSIGTQMHIDNDITHDSVVSMFDSLKQFNLPIEITEFDLAMTSGVDNLSEAEVQDLRDKKMSEVVSAINECALRDNIRGFTIWSKTDGQNFRVTLENEIRINNGLEPIKTLHGGFYNNDMTRKTKSLTQTFNYHTHTNRCGHAGYQDEKEYIKSAKEAGFTSIGFSDHVPTHRLKYRELEERMDVSQVDEYISSIDKLKEENPDMNIIVGFEAEFDPMSEEFLGELRDKVDYMILGQHFIPNVAQKNNPNYPLLYADMVCQAMESGLFDIVAHPDIFMKYRDTMETTENKALFMKNALIASNRICDKAKEIGIPLELNLNGAQQKRLSDGEYPYPHSLFWKAAEKSGNQVLFGVDAHYPKQFLRANSTENRIGKIIDLEKMNFVPKDYNPVVERKNNKTLQGLLESRKQSTYTMETHLAEQLINGVISKESGEDLGVALQNRLKDISNNLAGDFDKQKNKIEKYSNKVSEDSSLSNIEKTFKLNTAIEGTSQIKMTYQARSEFINLLSKSVNDSIDMGCRGLEIKNSVLQMVEAKTTKDPQRKSDMINSLNETANRIKANNNSNNNGNSKNKPVTYQKTSQQSKPSTGGSSSNNGFVDNFTISMMVAFGILITSALFFFMIYS